MSKEGVGAGSEALQNMVSEKLEIKWGQLSHSSGSGTVGGKMNTSELKRSHHRLNGGNDGQEINIFHDKEKYNKVLILILKL